MPFFSVIIPVYNVEKCIQKCLDSLLFQTFKDFEIILIDDGSCDNSGLLCDAFSQNYAHVSVFHKKNGGVSSARNMGLEKACGEWIVFVDSDDSLESSYLQNFKELVDKGGDLLWQGFFCENWQRKSPQSLFLKKSFYSRDEFDSLVEESQSQSILGYLWCKSFKKRIIDKYNIRFNEKYCFIEDLVFVSSYLSFCEGVASTSKAGYNYLFSAPGKKFGEQDSFAAILECYNNFKIFFCSDEKKLDCLFIDFMIVCFFISSKNKSVSTLTCENKFLRYRCNSLYDDSSKHSLLIRFYIFIGAIRVNYIECALIKFFFMLRTYVGKI